MLNYLHEGIKNVKVSCWWSTAQLMCISAHWIKVNRAYFHLRRIYFPLFCFLATSNGASSLAIGFSLSRATRRVQLYFIYVFVQSCTCIVAQPLPLFSPPVQPGAEAHQDDPAGPSQTGDEGRLLHHVRDAVVALWARHYVRQLCAWGGACTCTRKAREKQRKTNGMTSIYLLIVWMEM